MSDIHSFESQDKRFIFHVKREFLQECAKPHTIDTYDLMTKYKMNQYLHNTTGPAIIRIKDNYQEYWIDGQVVPKELGEKMSHDEEFSNKLLSEISK